MRAVSISELKARLSKYLRDVQRGHQVQVLDRGVPVARLVPIEGPEVPESDRRNRLIKAGILEAGSGDASGLLEHRPIRTNANLAAALEAERTDRL